MKNTEKITSIRILSFFGSILFVGVSALLIFGLTSVPVAQAADRELLSLSVQPERCIGWENAAQAQQIDLLGSDHLQEFSQKNSAVFHNQPSVVNTGDVVGETSTEPSIVCSNFSWPDEVPRNQVFKSSDLIFSLALDGNAENADVVSLSMQTTDGEWVSLESLAFVERIDNATRGGYWRYTLPLDGQDPKTVLEHLKIRAEYDAVPTEQTTTAWLDGVAVELNFEQPVQQPLNESITIPTENFESYEAPEIIVSGVQPEPWWGKLGIPAEERTVEELQLVDPDGNIITPSFDIEETTVGDLTTQEYHLRPDNFSQPGKYTLTLTVIEDGETTTITRDFSWGVLTININQSIFAPNDEAYIQMGVLDETGHTLCDAQLQLEITNPAGDVTTLSTGDDTIHYSGECAGDSVVSLPDYFTYYENGSTTGRFELQLTAVTDNGTYEISDYYDVETAPQFIVERSGPTRIWPIAPYTVALSITPQADFAGTVQEYFPENFYISDQGDGAMSQGVITWNVNWTAGETYQLSYKFDAPDISPELFMLGALNLTATDGTQWQESRQWQIASDAASAVTWDGSSSALWSDGANWSTGAIPKAGDNLVFPAGAANYSNTNDLGDNFLISSITFDDDGYALSGDTIILGQGLAGITDNATSGGNTISLNVRVDSTRWITVSNSGETLTIDGTIAGAGGLYKEGVGTLVLSGGNTYGGTVKINGGVLSARNNTALGTIALGTEVVGEAALELQGGISVDREPLTLRGYGVSSAGALRNVSNDNSFDGLITIAGVAEIASDAGTLTLNGGVTGTFPLNLDGAGNITFAKAPIAIATGTLTKNGAGTVTYNFPNTYTGTTVVNAGTLNYGVDNAILSGGITVNGGTVDVATYSDMVGTVTLGTLAGGTGTITSSTGVLSSAAWTVYAGTISAIMAGDAGTVTKTTPATVTLTRPNLYTGATTVSVGVLKIQDGDALGTIDGITTVTSGATLQIDGDGLTVPEYITVSGLGLLNVGGIYNTTGDNTITGLITMAAASTIEPDLGTTLTIATHGITGAFALTLDGEGDTVVSAPIAITTGTLTKNGAGTATLTAFNPFTGATTINRGSLTLNSYGAINMSASIAINSDGTLVMDNSSVVADRVGDAIAVTMNGGYIDFYGNNSADSIASLGALTLSTGQNNITVHAGSGGYTILRFASLTRTAGATGIFRGPSLGATPAAGVATLLFTTAPTLVGDDGVAGTPTLSIIQGIFGDDSTTGTGTDMVTYGRGNNYGVRLLNGAGYSNEYTTDLTMTNANVKLSTATAATTGQINSLVLGSSASITDAGSAQNMTFTSGNILNLNSSGVIDGANTTLAGGTVELIMRTPEDLAVSALITTTGGLSKSGDGTLTFSRANSYTGLTSINAGTLLYGINNALNSGALTINDATVDIATYTDTVAAVTVQGGTLTGDTGVLTATSYAFRQANISAVIAGSGAVTITNTNERADAVTNISRNNTFTGAVTVSSGILELGGAGDATNTPLGTTAAGVTVSNGAMLDLNGYTLGTAEAVNFRGTGIASQGAIVNTSDTDVTYSGALTITTSGRIGADYGKITISGNISGNTLPLTVGGFGDIDITGVIGTTTGTVTKDGLGTYTPSGDNTYTGVTTISAGTLKLGANGGGTNTPLGTTGGATSITSGATFDLNGYTLGTAEPLTLNGVGSGTGDFAAGALVNTSGSSVTWSGLLTLGSASTIKANSGSISLTASGTITGAALVLTLGGSGTGSISSIIGTTTGAFTKIDAGTWTLSGLNTFTGASTIYQGTLQLGASASGTASPLGTSGSGTTVLSGGVLDLNGYSMSAVAEALTFNGFGIAGGGAVINNSGSGVTYAGTRALGSDARTTNSGAGALTLSGVQSGVFESRYGGAGDITISAAIAATASSLLKDGAGTVTLTAANGHTGVTTVNAGTLAEGINNSLSSGSLVINGGTFNIATFTDTVGAVTMTDGTLTGSTGVLTATGYTLESGTISGIIAGAVAVTKNTAGTVTLSSVSTISSTLTINAGTFEISGSGSAVSVTAVTVNPTATLTLDNSSTAVASRLLDTIVITMNGGNLNFKGNASSTAAETLGQLALATGHSVVTITPGAGGSTTLTFGTNPGLNRTAGATVLFRGTSFGSTPAANVSTLKFTTAPTVTGAGGAANSTTISVIKGAFGDNSLSGTGTDMVTYNLGNTDGLRLLNGAGFAGEYATNLATANANVKLTANTAAAATNTNSLILNGYDITNPGGAVTIPMASASLSGNILMDTANTIAGSNTTLGITTFELDVLAPADGTISAAIGTATTGLMTLSGAGNVTLSGTNLYTGITYVNQATYTYGASNVLAASTVNLVLGTLDLNGNSDTINGLSMNGGTAKTGAGTLTLGTDVTGIANANVTSKITGNLALGANRIFNIGDGLVEDDLNVTAVVSGGFTVTKSTGTGVLVFGGDNTYTGSTTISTGTLRLGAAGGGTNTPLGTTAGATTVASGAALDLNGYSLGTSEALTISGTGVSTKGAILNTKSSAVTYSGLITLGAAATIQSDYGTITISNTGSMTGVGLALTLRGAGNGSIATQVNTGAAGTLVKSDLGTWTISGDSNYTGSVTVNSGVLKLGAAGGATNTPLGTSGGNTVVTGGLLDLNGYTLGIAEPLTLNGSGIASSGAVITNSSSSTSFSGAITMSTATRIANYGSGTFSLSGNISGNFALTLVSAPGTIAQTSSSVWSGSGTLVKEGSGTATLAGQNSVTGAMTVSTGTLQVAANGGATNTPLGTIAGGVTVSAGGVLDLSTYVVGGSSTWEILNLSGTGLKNGGALISSAASGNNFGATTIAANARVINSGSGTITFAGTITAANTISFAVGGTGNVTVSGAFGASATSATVTKWGDGTLTFSGTNPTTGLYRVNAGTLKISAATTLATAPVTVAGGTFDINGVTDTIGAVTLVSGTITDSNGAPGALSGSSYTFYGGAISAVLGGTSIAMTKSTGDTLTANKSFTDTGTLTINAGTVQYLASNVIANTASVTVAGGTLDLQSNSDTIATATLTSGSIIGSGTLTGTSYAVASGSISAVLAGAVNLSKTTTGTVTLSGTNTYTGITTIGGGILSVSTIGNGGVAGNLGAATNLAANIVFSTATGTLQYTGSTASTDRNFTTTAAITAQFDITNPSVALTMSGAATATTAPLTKVGPGTLIVSGANLNTGTTTVLAGTFKYGAADVITTGAVTVTNGTLDLNSYSDTVGTVTLTNGGQIIDSAGTSSVLTSTATYALQSGKVSAKLGSSVAAGISKTTTDRVILSGDNTYTSTSIALSAGKLNVQHNNALGAAGTSLTLTVTSGAALETQNNITVPSTKVFTLNGTGINTEGAIRNIADSNTLAGAITLGATGVRINSYSGTLTCSGAMSGATFAVVFGGAGDVTYSGAIGTTSGTLTKDGTGTLALTVANTYTGITTVSAGSLNIRHATATGTTAGGVTVADGAALQMQGNITVGAETLTLNGTGVSSDGALRNISDSNTWQGTVTLSTTSAIGADAGTLTVSGTITGSGSVGLTKVGAGTVSTATTNVGGDLTISAGTLSAAGNYTVGGNWSNGGTFTAGSATVTLNGSAQQTVSGYLTGTSAFNALTITNASGSDPDTSPSVIFLIDADATTFTAVTANTKIRFNAGSTYTFTNISFNGQASGTKVYLRSSSGGSAWNLAASGTRSVSYTDVKDSDATLSGTAIDATDGTNADSTGNTNWTFSITGITISGTCDMFDQSTDCTDIGTVKVAVDGSVQAQEDTVIAGTWDISGVAVTSGQIVTVWIDAAASVTDRAGAVAKYDGTGDMTGLALYTEHLTIGSVDDQTITNANIGSYDNSIAGGDDDVFWEVDAGNDLVVDVEAQSSQEELYIASGDTFRPASGGGANVTTTHVENASTWTTDANLINVSGNWVNSGTFSADTSTITFSAADTDNIIEAGVSSFNNVTFEGADGSGTWTVQTDSLTVTGALDVDTSDIVSIASGMTLTHSGTTLTLDGTISGSGTLRIMDTSSGPGANGTLSSLVRYDASTASISNTTFDARTYDGPVELYANSGTAKSITAAAGGYTFASTLTTTAGGAGTVTADLSAATGTTTVTGALTIGATTLFSAPTALSLGGHYTNNGTFTDNSGTVTLAGSAQQTMAGTMTGSSDFNNLTVTNASGSDPDTAPSVIFSADATTAGTFTATTASTKLRFLATGTYTFQNINFNGQAITSRVALRSSSSGSGWNLNVAGTRTVRNTDAKDSNACGQAPNIDASHVSNLDSTGNSCWDFDTLTFSISDTTVGFGDLLTGSARYATGDLSGTSTFGTAAHTLSIFSAADSGYVITYYGATLTDGGNTIDAATVTNDNDGAPGTEQFALGATTNGDGTIASEYNANSTAEYKFVPGVTTPFFSESGATATETISLYYLGNIAGTTQAGDYSTEITYVATGSF